MPHGVLPDRPNRRDDVLPFYGDDITVPLLAFSSTIKDMRRCCTMPEPNISPTAPRVYSAPVRSALDLIESLLVEGIKHGHFDYSITCETGTGGRRLLIVTAGKSHKFTIIEPEVPE
jgi:hypothetical protein